jgi:hypothetical protein
MMTFQHRHIVDADPAGPQILRASSLSSLKPLSYFNGRSRFNLSSQARVFFGVIGIFTGTYSNSSSALAETEENSWQAVNAHGYSIPTLSSNILTGIFISSYAVKEVVKYLSTLNNSHNDVDPVHRDAETYTSSRPALHSSTNPPGFDDPLIPEAVWSLDASTGAHLDRISGGPGSDIYAVFGSRAEINDFWMRAIASSLIYNNTAEVSGLFFAPIEFQVASCGGSSAEHSDLDYCNSVKLLGDQLKDSPVKSEQNNSNTATQSASNVFSSNGPPDFNSTAQPITTPLTPVIADQSLLADQSPLRKTLSVLGPCDVSASCARVAIDPLETPVDAPALDPPSLIGDLTPPFDSTSSEPPISGPTDGGDPGSDSSPPPDLSSQSHEPPVPEASTWVMTVVGFSLMAFTFSKRRRTRNNPISIIDVSEET